MSKIANRDYLKQFVFVAALTVVWGKMTLVDTKVEVKY